jgi:hypothetical protein
LESKKSGRTEFTLAARVAQGEGRDVFADWEKGGGAITLATRD